MEAKKKKRDAISIGGGKEGLLYQNDFLHITGGNWKRKKEGDETFSEKKEGPY